MKGWRGTWAAAQITGAVFSSLVWIVVWGLSLPALLVTMAVGTVLVIGRNTRPMLWWRFGAKPANDFQRNTVLAAIVPIASLRGRRQPSVWIGHRLAGGHVVMPARSVLVVSPDLVRQVVSGQLADRQASVMVSRAFGQIAVRSSIVSSAVEFYCIPWQVVRVFLGVLGQVAARHRILGFCWRIRWIVFAMAVVDAYRSARWTALIGVVLIAVLSWSTGYLEKRWALKLQGLADHRAIHERLGAEGRRDRGDALERPSGGEQGSTADPWCADRAAGSN